METAPITSQGVLLKANSVLFHTVISYCYIIIKLLSVLLYSVANSSFAFDYNVLSVHTLKINTS